MDISTDRLVVTPEGKLKLFWAHIRPKNGHLPYYQCLLYGEKPSGCFSPEELESIRNRERSVRIDHERSNVYTFGMCLFYCMTLVNPTYFYTAAPSLDLNELNRTLSTYRQKNVYSGRLWQLLENCLQPLPSQRPRFRELQAKFSGMFQEDFALSMGSNSQI